MMMTLIRKHLTVVQEMPLVLRSWLTLIPLEDFPEFSELTGAHPGLLIQALLYRLRQPASGTTRDHLNEQVSLTYRRVYGGPMIQTHKKLSDNIGARQMSLHLWRYCEIHNGGGNIYLYTLYVIGLNSSRHAFFIFLSSCIANVIGC